MDLEDTLLTDVMERVKTYEQLIDGKFVAAASGDTLEIENPANDQVIAKFPASAAEDVDRAVDAAETAFQTGKHTTPQDRSLICAFPSVIAARDLRPERWAPTRE